MKLLGYSSVLSLIIFVAGFILKFFRTPFHTVIMLVGLGLLLISAIGYLIKRRRLYAVGTLVTFFSGVFLLSVVKFWPVTVFLSLALLCLIISGVVFYQAQKVVDPKLVIAAIMFMGGVGLLSMPKSELYYLLNLKYSIHAQDYYALDKYSWFLNLDNRQPEALKVSTQAYEMASQVEDVEMADFIGRHKELLEENNWKNFRQ